MLENDVQLIRRVLLGDDSAFSTLVQKHQKGVHALVWRKVKDFHYAEEITQDVFVQVYKKLGTLKDPKCFAGWLYVIAKRLSLNWIQRHKPAMPSLEETPVVEIEESSYNHYMSERRETESAEHRSEIASEILETLPESERTVVTLHYLGEMTTTEISKYLGVSVNTIKSRLRRGRERLQTSESLVREMLGGVQLSADLTERVMREVADINPTAPPAGKPLIPWTAFGAAAVLIVLILGAGNQYLARFQKPYSFDAQSEPTVEIVDAPITLDIIAQPATRRQFGQTPVPNNNAGAGIQVSEATLRSRGQEDRLNFSTTQWTQTGGPPGGHVRDIFATSQGSVYAIAPIGIYKLTLDASGWTHINSDFPIVDDLMPMVENQGTLYIVSTDEIFASTDNGETWNAFCSRPKGIAVGLIITEAPQHRNRQSDMTMYLAFRDEGVFRSTDAGIQWAALNDGLGRGRMTTIAAVGNTVFAGTNQGLYRLDSDTWNLLPVGASETVYSMAVSESNLYAGMGPDLHGPLLGLTLEERNRMVLNNELSPSKIFHSDDLGASWTDITPKHKTLLSPKSGIQILAIGETLLALGHSQFRSTDGGKNWTYLGKVRHASMLNYIPSVAVNDKTFYKVGAFGIHRTTDGGESWDLFMNGVMGTRIVDLVTFNNRLYTYNGIEVSQSIDGGASWKNVSVNSEVITPESVKQNSGPAFDFASRLLVANNILYLLAPSENILRISGLSTDGNVLIPIHNVPVLEPEPLPRGLSPYSQEERHIIISHIIENTIKSNTLAISGDMFYLEFRRTLFKWKLGDPTWTNTGFVDTPQGTDADEQENFKLAVSGDTVYVGKRDGKLFQSLDEGGSWKDLTPNLPLRFSRFNEIVFSGSTVFVATDKGVLVSRNAEHWQTVTDTTNKRIVINQLAVDAHTVYGINDIGVFHLNTRGQWEQISSEVPDEVISLTILNNRLYGVTEQHGMFHMLLESIY